MYFRVFSEGQGTKWRIFFGLLNIKYLYGVPEILDIFGGWMVDAGPEPTYEEKIRVSPPPPVQPFPVKCI